VICGLLLVLSRPALVRSKCPRLVASEIVIPGNWTQPLAMALAKVEDVGDPIAALKNDTFWSLEVILGRVQTHVGFPGGCTNPMWGVWLR
jgi:hypothetical protein